jgi:hypothetical protein
MIGGGAAPAAPGQVFGARRAVPGTDQREVERDHGRDQDQPGDGPVDASMRVIAR